MFLLSVCFEKLDATAWNHHRAPLSCTLYLAAWRCVPRHLEVSYICIIVSQCCHSTNIMSNQLTSSTAQGGGGSFKHRKAIGEVGCCESGMAERSH